MNREDMVNAMVRKTGFMRKDAEAALEAVFQIITGALSNGDRVQVTGLRTFEVKNRAPRVGRNPKDNTPVQIPARKSPSFKAGKALKEAVGAPR